MAQSNPKLKFEVELKLKLNWSLIRQNVFEDQSTLEEEMPLANKLQIRQKLYM